MRLGNLSCWWGIQTPWSLWEIPVILLYPSASCHNPGWHENSWGKSTLGSTLPFSGDYTSLPRVTVSSPNAFHGVLLLQILGEVYPESLILYQPCCALKCQALGQGCAFPMRAAYLCFAILKTRSPVMAILAAGDEELLHIHAGKERFRTLGGYSCNFPCLPEVHLQPLFWTIHLRNNLVRLVSRWLGFAPRNPEFLLINHITALTLCVLIFSLSVPLLRLWVTWGLSFFMIHFSIPRVSYWIDT